MIPTPCLIPGCPTGAVVAYVNVFGVERAACSEHSQEVRRASARERGVGCIEARCGRYAVGLLQFDDGRTGWAACDQHRGAIRAANPEAEWLPSEVAGGLRVLDLTGPVDAPDDLVIPPGAYDPDLPRCWLCGRREGFEHDTAEDLVDPPNRHQFTTSAGAVAAISPELRARCRTEYLDGVQTGRARRGLELLTPAELDATFTPFDPPPEPGRASPKELAEVARRYPELPAEFRHEYALRARAAAERRVERESKRS